MAITAKQQKSRWFVHIVQEYSNIYMSIPCPSKSTTQALYSHITWPHTVDYHNISTQSSSWSNVGLVSLINLHGPEVAMGWNTMYTVCTSHPDLFYFFHPNINFLIIQKVLWSIHWLKRTFRTMIWLISQCIFYQVYSPVNIIKTSLRSSETSWHG